MSPRASVPNTVPRAELGAPLQITVPVCWLVTVLVLLFVLFNDMLIFFACIRCS
jgi:hypothetical protein